MDEDAERKMDELLGDAYVKHILRQWTSQIQNLIVRNDIGELKGLQRYTARNISYIRVLLATEARRFASRPISNFKSKNATPEIEIVRALLPPAPAPVPAPIATQTRAATKKRRLSERNAEQEIAHVPRNRINITRKRPRTGAMSNN